MGDVAVASAKRPRDDDDPRAAYAALPAPKRPADSAHAGFSFTQYAKTAKNAAACAKAVFTHFSADAPDAFSVRLLPADAGVAEITRKGDLFPLSLRQLVEFQLAHPGACITVHAGGALRVAEAAPFNPRALTRIALDRGYNLALRDQDGDVHKLASPPRWRCTVAPQMLAIPGFCGVRPEQLANWYINARLDLAFNA